jgi:hypothetical protein
LETIESMRSEDGSSSPRGNLDIAVSRDLDAALLTS